ncbi:MAG: LysM peptidoglycan-binding domain-containing protein [Verrucomicrobiaceae bacterium]|nr:LysM peptidoglycan-binding domain-containing protein [Verrucomicrobiaceae bacterium]
MKTKKTKQDSLIIKLLDGGRHKHRVALVTDEGEWNQHEPNTGMARMFVVMLLIHVVLIGGIIIYDFMGEEDSPAQSITQAARAQSVSGLPQASEAVISAQANAVANGNVGDEYEIYEMRSGDSLPLLAQRFSTTEQVLTELNLLDKGITIGPGTRLRIPKQPVTAAIPVDPATLQPAGSADEVPKAVPFVLNSPPATQGAVVKPEDAPASISAAASPMSLVAPGEAPPAAGNSLLAAADAPATTPVPAENTELISTAPNPQSVSVLAQAAEENEKALAAAAAGEKVEAEAKPEPKPEEPKKIIKSEPKPLAKPNPVPTPSQMVKRLADAPPATKSTPKKSTTKDTPPKSAPKSSARSHTLAEGETLYRLSTKYGVSVDALIKANSIKNPNAMRPGTKLVIPAK